MGLSSPEPVQVPYAEEWLVISSKIDGLDKDLWIVNRILIFISLTMGDKREEKVLT